MIYALPEYFSDQNFTVWPWLFWMPDRIKADIRPFLCIRSVKFIGVIVEDEHKIHKITCNARVL